ncbi:MAG: hypothetical protein KDD47_27665, partial [Acidobacteria bacterium]|nr:hypothetical protein [Acidobacteriota bacterium]
MRRAHVALLSFVLALGAAPTFGRSWDENTDGGEDAGIQTAAQATTGVAPLTSISGSLRYSAGDHVDCYRITVSSDSGFYATTDASIDPNASSDEGDTRLWIFSGPDGAVAISGNDDAPQGSEAFSYVADESDPSFSTPPSNPVVTPLDEGEPIVLCISYYPNDPQDAADVDLIDMEIYTALSGPNPAAGSFDHWENMATNQG